MIRILSLTLALAAAPATAQEDLPLDTLIRQNAAAALARQMATPDNPGQAQVSQPQRAGQRIQLCATTDARNNSGSYIGRDYWEVTLSADGTEVLATRNVTGLLSPCYGADYAPFRELLGQ